MENLNKKDLEKVQGGSIVEKYEGSDYEGCGIYTMYSEEGIIIEEKTNYTDHRIKPKAGPPIPTL